MKTKIKDFNFVADAFGDLPIWSLWNSVAKKGSDAYILMPSNPDEPVQNKREAKVHDLFRRINDTFPLADIYITGEIEWKVSSKYKKMGLNHRCIVGLRIDHITIYPDIDKEEII